MSDITQIQVGSTTYDIKDASARAQNAAHHTYYVKGTQTASTGSWTGVLSDVDALYEGLAIDYWLPFAGNGNATLNLTMKDGTTTGPINCYHQSTNRLTTHVPEKTIIHLIYQTVTINGTDYTGWWYTKSQDTNDRAHILWHYGAFVADSAIYRYQLLFQKDENTLTPLNNVDNNIDTSKTMLTDVEFDPFGIIYYWDSTATKAANGTVDGGTPRYAFWAVDLRYTFNCGTTLTAHKPLYLKTSLQSNGKVKLASASPLAQTLPSSNDGYLYIYLGRTGSNYQLSLTPWHPIYYHNGTKVVEYKNIPDATTSFSGLMSAADKTKLNGLNDSAYLKLSGGTMTGQLKTSFHEAVAMGAYGSLTTTIPNLCEELRFSNGAVGSVQITEAYTKDGVTIPTRWYNFLWSPHRSGGVNGQASGDNCNNGCLLLMGMSNPGFYMIRYHNSAIAELKDIYKDNDNDVKVTNTLANTTKYYVTGTTSNSTNTGTQSFDTGIYATTTAGQLNATTYKVNEQVTLQWNSTDQSLDFVFA